jgi:hypothetical protein
LIGNQKEREDMKTKHTQEPWKIGNVQEYQSDRYAKNAEWARIRGTDGSLIAKIESVHPRGERKSSDFDVESGNAARIVSCVNSCAGINPEAVPDLVEALKGLCNVALHPLSTKAQIRQIAREAREALTKAQNQD